MKNEGGVMFTATTILAVKKDGHTAMAGDGQVTMGNAVIMKNTARKVRRLYHGKIIAGFAGSVADAFSLFDKFEAKLSDCSGNLVRAAVEFAKDWRRDRVLQKLEALLILTDGEHLFLVSGSGEVIEPDDGILAIGSGGNYALAAARALSQNTGLSAREVAEKSLHIAADICVYTNHNVIVEEI
jgi:ATP-dependent HslUV protease subunit HslV